ncbi:extracellular rhamnogalacturonase [Penicillium lagena]|uniref:extracellular rhamnogalacturonase n=1 Tax=Penicillium lagena TaxID=94218 RepID=UPI0025400547|nr:extracellular rhamnogalacturonase [Penicillium lagena]KAJ5620186.1 extracellular rhamnogalacturonase [Penicillium lagena]
MQVKSLLLSFGYFSVAWAQLADTSDYPIGPLTSSATKWATKICDITNYGAVADGETDSGPAILAAFNACASGGVVNIPLGTFALATWVTLSGGNAWAINLEGVIVRTGTAGGNMIYIEHSTDFEIYSSRGEGAIQGYGYEFLSQGEYGPRLLRLYDVTNFAIHDIALVDSPAFHLTLDTCNQGEVYNMIIRGANEGGLDGIDLWGFDIWVHDVEVTNKDECVTVKSPANHILVEDIYCNWSGGCAMGSLGTDTDITKVVYNNIYTVNSNQMFMFKSNGGNGSVTDVTLQNFIGHENAYSLYIDAYWTEETLAAGDGVLYNSITFSNWTGTCANGAQRAPLYVLCPSTQPCTNIVIEDFAMWTESGSTEYYKCADAWGSGYCLHGGSEHTEYGTVTSTFTSAPSGYSAPTMPGQLTAGLGITTSIAIPTVPTTFFPGATPATARVYSG